MARRELPMHCRPALHRCPHCRECSSAERASTNGLKPIGGFFSFENLSSEIQSPPDASPRILSHLRWQTVVAAMHPRHARSHGPLGTRMGAVPPALIRQLEVFVQLVGLVFELRLPIPRRHMLYAALRATCQILCLMQATPYPVRRSFRLHRVSFDAHS